MVEELPGRDIPALTRRLSYRLGVALLAVLFVVSLLELLVIGDGRLLASTMVGAVVLYVAVMLILLVRVQVSLTDGLLVIRNPMRTFRVPLADVVAVEERPTWQPEAVDLIVHSRRIGQIGVWALSGRHVQALATALDVPIREN